MAKRDKGELNELPDDARVTLEIYMPAAMKRLLVAEGKKELTSPGMLVRTWAAERIGYDMPPTYGNTGRPVMTRAERAEEKELMRKLMDAYKKGLIQI